MGPAGLSPVPASNLSWCASFSRVHPGEASVRQPTRIMLTRPNRATAVTRGNGPRSLLSAHNSQSPIVDLAPQPRTTPSPPIPLPRRRPAPSSLTSLQGSHTQLNHGAGVHHDVQADADGALGGVLVDHPEL